MAGLPLQQMRRGPITGPLRVGGTSMTMSVYGSQSNRMPKWNLIVGPQQLFVRKQPPKNEKKGKHGVQGL